MTAGGATVITAMRLRALTAAEQAKIERLVRGD